ncbi:Spy/CpxP family protein refolding chaperone [Thalassotalea mangrovi]|uniref:Periplasmic heavy metal sensor n=1 Tax=Thalassotalea mangrovi TaxID=2572245 RepID=A0A4U1B825_9GAMM|nr:Spy/CpxP family protein refolding chaperone [Thalassotalea mangrovi]TKB46659.1 periplasmic heavy metal sensor [Thalassotalea mangrovi]
MQATGIIKSSIIAVLLASLAFASMAYDKHRHQGERGSHPTRIDKLVRALDLTDEQQQQIKAIREASKQEMDALTNDKQQHHEEMQAIITADTFDQNAFIALHQDRADKRQQIALIHAKSMHDIYHLLEPAQQQKFKKMLAKRRSR